MESANQSYGSGPTMQLARWISALKYGDVPAHTREVVRLVLLDTIGCGLYGYRTPWTQAIGRWVQAGGARGKSRTWQAEPMSLRAADAALVNGVSVHAFELDDYHNTKLHPGAVVIPAALAVAEEHNISGEKLVASIAAGYEVMIRSSMALEPSAARLRGWHLTGACGPFGAAAACAVLLGLDAERTAWALGLAGTQGAGLWAFNADGAMSKRLHAGKAAHSGVMAAELAAEGFTGPTQIYEFEDGGFLKAFSDKSNAAPLTQALGETWHLDNVSIKPYSCCASTHAYIDAALELRKRAGGRWEASWPVRVGMSNVVNVQCGFDYQPGTALNAQMSLRYCVAAALMDGQVLPAQFTDARMRHPALVELAGALVLENDPALDQLYPAHFAGWVSANGVGIADNEWTRVDILDPTGSTAAPVDWHGVVRKFKSNCPDFPVDQIANMVYSVEQYSVRALVDLLTTSQIQRAVA